MVDWLSSSVTQLKQNSGDRISMSSISFSGGFLDKITVTHMKRPLMFEVSKGAQKALARDEPAAKMEEWKERDSEDGKQLTSPGPLKNTEILVTLYKKEQIILVSSRL